MEIKPKFSIKKEQCVMHERECDLCGETGKGIYCVYSLENGQEMSVFVCLKCLASLVYSYLQFANVREIITEE